MESLNTITSAQNERYKALVKMLGKKLPTGQVVLEGKRLVQDALQAGIQPDLLVFSDDVHGRYLADSVSEYACRQSLFLAPNLFSRLADTVTPQGVLMVASIREYELKDVSTMQMTRLVLLDSLADPGNVGAISRSAEAFGFDLIMYVNGGVSPLSRKAVRASMGSILRQQVVKIDNMVDALDTLRKAHVSLFALDAGGRDLTIREDISSPVALLVGNEAHGLSKAVRQAKPTLLRIPMQGKVESLNAAIATAIAMYEIGKNTCK